MSIKKKKTHPFFKLLLKYGLKINSKTGGSFYPDVYINKIQKVLDFYELDTKNGEILFLDGNLFFDTLLATEKSMKVNLFSKDVTFKKNINKSLP
jgi:hypothetical protein